MSYLAVFVLALKTGEWVNLPSSYWVQRLAGYHCSLLHVSQQSLYQHELHPGLGQKLLD